MENNYGPCKFCGAKMVKSPKTGKIFCSDKCWLKPSPQPQNSPSNASEWKKPTMTLEQRIEVLIHEVQVLIEAIKEQTNL